MTYFRWVIDKKYMTTNKKMRNAYKACMSTQSIHLEYRKVRRYDIWDEIIKINEKKLMEKRDVPKESAKELEDLKTIYNELEDLEKIYRDSIEDLDECIEGTGPYFRLYMMEHLELHKKRVKMQEKLDNLLQKMGKSDEDDDSDDSDDSEGDDNE